LLALKVDVDACGEWKSTPLHVASVYGQEEVIKVLLKEGANIEARNDWGMRPLFLAAEQGADSIVSLLLQHGACTEKTASGRSPLHTAAENGYEEVSRILIEGGARIEAEDNRKCTPLHVAAIAGQRAMVELLLKKGANIEARDHIKWTPLHRAIAEDHGNVVRFLLRQGADIQAEGILLDRNRDRRPCEKITPLRLLAQSRSSSLRQIAAEMRLTPMASASDSQISTRYFVRDYQKGWRNSKTNTDTHCVGVSNAKNCDTSSKRRAKLSCVFAVSNGFVVGSSCLPRFQFERY
jgi:hypothetical protein